ncbi:hypothetical protein [Blastochloris sulfoviridis]|uniref:Uncharacterized protein n=1 Tax=Blastochloris sulfoviridis TaxID=50712 RepID=A0A5M6I4L1_9HYPH|nr:hypothetical protein [Blastochloris sulfoviridis]KAA5603166.1 hypothetical protein F1193_02780 [Blastochloris sulfoviridis]
MAALSIRLVSLAVVLCGLWWVATVVPLTVRDDAVLAAGRRILNEETLPPQAIARLGPIADRLEPQLACEVATWRAVALFRLRVAEAAEGDDAGRIAWDDFREAARRLLVCSPHEPLFWFALFWQEATQVGIQPGSYDRLRLSYALGANEAWIMRKRSRLMLPLLATVPEDLREPVLHEFITLLKSRVMREAVEAFQSSDTVVREMVLPRLVDVPEPVLAGFSRALRNAGVEAKVPGRVERERRPWDR